MVRFGYLILYNQICSEDQLTVRATNTLYLERVIGNILYSVIGIIC